jgi:hypothetical protein
MTAAGRVSGAGCLATGFGGGGVAAGPQAKSEAKTISFFIG